MKEVGIQPDCATLTTLIDAYKRTMQYAKVRLNYISAGKFMRSGNLFSITMNS